MRCDGVAVGLLAQMAAEELIPDVISFSAVIGACGSSAAWDSALVLLADMQAATVRTDAAAAGAVLGAVAKACPTLNTMACWQVAAGSLLDGFHGSIDPR
ncbi:Znfx1 [Symbiodinium sp. CCMP2592]|nr:Znfx1 [Symbiodinium sp. CCMP2592]